MLRPLDFGVPYTFYQHWTQVSYTGNSSPVVLINDGTQMAAGVASGAAPARDQSGAARSSRRRHPWRIFGNGLGTFPSAASAYGNLSSCAHTQSMTAERPRSVPSQIRYNEHGASCRSFPASRCSP